MPSTLVPTSKLFLQWYMLLHFSTVLLVQCFGLLKGMKNDVPNYKYSRIYLNRFCHDGNRDRFSSIVRLLSTLLLFQFVTFLAGGHFFGNGFAAVLQFSPNFSFGSLFAALSVVCLFASVGLSRVK